MTEQPSSPAPRVLVVEDDPVLSELVARLLHRNGLVYETAGDGAAAIEDLGVNTYQAIVLDLMMPKVDGFGVIEWLRANRPELLPTVIVMTATSDQQLARLKVNELGGVIRKPFEIHELGRIIRGALGLPPMVEQIASRETLLT